VRGGWSSVRFKQAWVVHLAWKMLKHGSLEGLLTNTADFIH
jgi:hypothetical protein